MNITKKLKTTALAGLALTGMLAFSGCTSTDTSAENIQPDASSASSEWPDPFVFAIIPQEDNTDLVPQESVQLAYLIEELGLNVEYHLATSYAATIEAQRSGKAHMATYGPFSYVLAKDSGVDLVPFVTKASSPNDQAGYYSVASVLADSDIETLEDVKGGTVCFVDPGSTSGYLFPSAGLLAAGIDPEGDDITPIFAGGHDASVLALADGQCDLAFSTDNMAETQLIESGQLEAGTIKQIWQSELIPADPMTLTGSVPDDLKELLLDTYLNVFNVDAMTEAGTCDTSEGTEYCGLGTSWGYMEVDDSVYDGVRAVCDITESEACAAIQ